MAVNTFNTGRDVSIQVVAGGSVLALNIKTGFEAKPLYDKRTSKGLDGVNRFIVIPAGWQGTIELDRQDSNVDIFYASQESKYYNGEAVTGSTITETITNTDGSVTIFQFTGVMFSLEEGGQWKGDDKVMMRMGWEASSRKQLP